MVGKREVRPTGFVERAHCLGLLALYVRKVALERREQLVTRTLAITMAGEMVAHWSGPYNESGVQLRAPRTTSPDGITQQALGLHDGIVRCSCRNPCAGRNHIKSGARPALASCNALLGGVELFDWQ